jgi:hypothetical protein
MRGKINSGDKNTQRFASSTISGYGQDRRFVVSNLIIRSTLNDAFKGQSK